MAISPTSRAARFWAEGTEITARAVAEFNDTGIPVAVPPVRFGKEEAEPTEPPPQEAASPAQVKKMVESGEKWAIAVSLTAGATTGTFVVTRELLADALAETDDPAKVDARRASASERLLFESAPKLLGPEAAFDRVKGAMALPVSQAALIGTTGGLFGLAALEDSIARPILVFFAVLLALAAVGSSLLGTHALRTVMFVPARIDLVRKRYEELVIEPMKASNRGVFLLLAAAVPALFAVWPASSPEKEQAGSISASIQRAASGHVAGSSR